MKRPQWPGLLAAGVAGGMAMAAIALLLAPRQPSARQPPVLDVVIPTASGALTPALLAHACLEHERVSFRLRSVLKTAIAALGPAASRPFPVLSEGSLPYPQAMLDMILHVERGFEQPRIDDHFARFIAWCLVLAQERHVPWQTRHAHAFPLYRSIMTDFAQAGLASIPSAHPEIRAQANQALEVHFAEMSERFARMVKNPFFPTWRDPISATLAAQIHSSHMKAFTIHCWGTPYVSEINPNRPYTDAEFLPRFRGSLSKYGHSLASDLMSDPIMSEQRPAHHFTKDTMLFRGGGAPKGYWPSFIGFSLRETAATPRRTATGPSRS